MFLTDQKNIFITLFLFFIFSTIWLWQFHGFQTIRYLEEIQLFRTDFLYFESFLSLPGGLTDYIGAFLTQFFYYPIAGALIISSSITLITLLFYFICKKEGTIESMFILIYPSAILLLVSCGKVFREAFLVSIILVLLLYLLYLYIPKRIQPISGIILFTGCWFSAGSFSFLLALLLLIHFLKAGRKAIIYIILLAVCSFLIPWLSYHYLYVTSWKKLLLPFLTLDRNYPNKLYVAGILSIPVIYSFWIFYLKDKTKEIGKPVRITGIYYILLICGMGIGFIFTTDISSEKKVQISHQASAGNWDKLLAISRSHTHKYNQENILSIACFTNMALSEKGELLEKMFNYQQPGTAGLFPNRIRDYSGYITTSEIYYRIGLIPEAEHQAFEALVISSGRHGSRPLKRLVESNALRRDTAGFRKYTNLLLQSPIHREWAKKEVNAFFETTQTNGSGTKPVPIVCDDFFVNYTLPEYNLIGLFRTNENNKKIFEYLLASLLLNKDMSTFTKFLHRYWVELGYNHLPQHVEEAILLCRYILGSIDDNQLKNYPVTEQKTKELMDFSVLVNKGNSKKNREEIKKKFGSTFWHYYYFTEPVKYQPEPEIPRY